MSGYKPGYSETHSPYYEAGKRDGERDTYLISQCPPYVVGPNPGLDWSFMYQRGYRDGFNPDAAHIHTAACWHDMAGMMTT